MILEEVQLQEGLSVASLSIYIPDSSIEKMIARPAILICPGGAYMGITEKEAEPVALRFLADGFCTFVLRYSVGAGLARFPAPFLDAAKAIMIIRQNSERWGINPNHICICGFSTGGQVAAVLGATWQEEYISKALNKDSYWFKPNSLILGYPVLDFKNLISSNTANTEEMRTLVEMMFLCIYGTGHPNEQLLEQWNVKNMVTKDMPPTFLWTTAEDSISTVQDNLDFIRSLAAEMIPYEFHLFEKGAHGLALGDRTAIQSDKEILVQGNTNKWVNLAINWLRQQERTSAFVNTNQRII